MAAVPQQRPGCGGTARGGAGGRAARLVWTARDRQAEVTTLSFAASAYVRMNSIASAGRRPREIPHSEAMPNDDTYLLATSIRLRVPSTPSLACTRPR